MGFVHAVVTRLLHGLHNRGHILVVDNAFSSVNLFYELMITRTWATGIIRCNHLNMPPGLSQNCEKERRGE